MSCEPPSATLMHADIHVCLPKPAPCLLLSRYPCTDRSHLLLSSCPAPRLLLLGRPWAAAPLSYPAAPMCTQELPANGNHVADEEAEEEAEAEEAEREAEEAAAQEEAEKAEAGPDAVAEEAEEEEEEAEKEAEAVEEAVPSGKGEFGERPCCRQWTARRGRPCIPCI